MVKVTARVIGHVDGNVLNSELANVRTIRVETWYLERPGADPVDLGGYFHAAQRALGALVRAERARR